MTSKTLGVSPLRLLKVAVDQCGLAHTFFMLGGCKEMLYYLVGEVKIEPLETAQPGPSSQREPRYIELNTSYNKSGLSGEFQFQSLPHIIT